MAQGAPKGNQFWKLRSKHGRDKLFETSDILWEAACEYFKWCDDNPLKEERVFHHQGKITRTEVSKMMAYTLTGLCLYLDCGEAYFRQFKGAIKDKKDELNKDFSTIIKRIERTIYQQKFTGAAADLLNPNIIARDLGLTDKTDNINKNLNADMDDKTAEQMVEDILNNAKKRK